MTQPKTTKSSESSANNQPSASPNRRRRKTHRHNGRPNKPTSQKQTTSQPPTNQSTSHSKRSTKRKNQSTNQASTQPQKRRSHRPGAKAVREYTAGGVVFRNHPKRGLEFLLIQDVKGRWSVPKGHVESGETLEQTAIREIGEETGLKDLEIVDKLDKVHFFYRFEGKLIFMTTFIFLVESLNNEEEVVVEVSEGIVAARWFPADKAEQVLEYKDLKTLMQRSLAIITERQTV